jgi:hypothetical protein
MGVCNLGVLTWLLMSFGLKINSAKTSVNIYARACIVFKKAEKEYR